MCPRQGIVFYLNLCRKLYRDMWESVMDRVMLVSLSAEAALPSCWMQVSRGQELRVPNTQLFYIPERSLQQYLFQCNYVITHSSLCCLCTPACLAVQSFWVRHPQACLALLALAPSHPAVAGPSLLSLSLSLQFQGQRLHNCPWVSQTGVGIVGSRMMFRDRNSNFKGVSTCGGLCLALDKLVVISSWFPARMQYWKLVGGCEGGIRGQQGNLKKKIKCLKRDLQTSWGKVSAVTVNEKDNSNNTKETWPVWFKIPKWWNCE